MIRNYVLIKPLCNCDLINIKIINRSVQNFNLKNFWIRNIIIIKPNREFRYNPIPI